jgi:hypothetical protein
MVAAFHSIFGAKSTASSGIIEDHLKSNAFESNGLHIQ